MDKVKVVLDGDKEILADGLFYLYNSKYYLMYTDKEIDENGYVVLHLVQVGKEIKKSDSGMVDTGYMVGVEVQDVEDWKNVQKSITTIVSDKKSGKESPEIQYLPMSMIKKIKILGSKKFRLVKDVLEQHFGLIFDEEKVIQPEESVVLNQEDIQNSNNIENNNLVEPVVDNKNESEENDAFNPVEIEDNTKEEIISPVNQVEESKPETPVLEANGGTADIDALIFKPNIENVEEIKTEKTNNDVQKNVPLVSIEEEPKSEEINVEDNKPVELFSEQDENIDYQALYNELKEDNENLKKRVQELEIKIENIKKILG